MAVTGSATKRWSGFDSDRVVRWVFNDLKILSPKTVPFLKLIGINGEAIDNPKIEWKEDALNGESVIHGSGTITSATVTTVTLATGEGYKTQAGQLLKVTGTLSSVANTEYVYVTDVTSDTLTVVRGVGGTSACDSILPAAVFGKVGVARKENVAPPFIGSTIPDTFYNYSQIFEKKWQHSQRQANTKLYGTNNDPAYQEAKHVQETMIELELACIHGKRAATSGDVPDLMGGLEYFLTANVTNLSDAPLEMRHLLDSLQDIYYLVGPDDMAKTILCGMDVKQQISDFFSPFVRTERRERTGGVIVDVIATDFGEIDVLESFRCPRSTLYFIKPDVIKIHPFKGGAFQVREVPADGAYTIRRIYGDYSMRVGQTTAQGKITNIQLLNT